MKKGKIVFVLFLAATVFLACNRKTVESPVTSAQDSAPQPSAVESDTVQVPETEPVQTSPSSLPVPEKPKEVSGGTSLEHLPEKITPPRDNETKEEAVIEHREEPVEQPFSEQPVPGFEPPSPAETEPQVQPQQEPSPLPLTETQPPPEPVQEEQPVVSPPARTAEPPRIETRIQPPARTVIPEPEADSGPEEALSAQQVRKPEQAEQPPESPRREAPVIESFAPRLISMAAPERIELNQQPQSGPEITVTSPQTISYYHSGATVSGYLSNFSGTATLSWILEGTAQSGTFKLRDGQGFSFDLDTAGLKETMLVRIKASADGSDESEKILILIDDNTGPAVIADSPGAWLNTTEDFSISGQIFNSSDDRQINEVKSVTAGIIGNSAQEKIDLSGTGTFRIDSSSQLFRQLPESNTVVQLKAEDYNGNINSEFFLLLKNYPDSVINLRSPSNGELFSDEIMVSGTAEGFSEIFWDIPGTAFSGTVKTTNSAFSFPIRLSGINDNCMLRISAAAGGKTAFATRNLYNSHRTPELVINSPVSGDFYKDSILLDGKISDSDDGKSSSERIKSISWSIPGTESNRNLIFFDTDGSFSLDIGTSSRNGLLPFEITAEDYNGNIGHNFVILQDGKTVPEVVLSSPAESSYFGAYLYIKGSVVDPYSGTPFGGIKKIDYSIGSIDDFSSKPVEGTIAINEKNAFNIEIPASEFSGRYQLSLTVEAENGNTAGAVRTIEKGGSDITGLSLNYSPGRLSADWNSIPGINNYTLYLSDSGDTPDETNSEVFSNVNPPIAMGGIAAGRLYRVRIRAEAEYGTLWSSTEEYLPADDRTFGLTASGEFKQIKLDWTSIPAIGTFSIYRASEDSDDFRLIKLSQSGTTYIDKDVSFGIDYRYYIAPEGYDYSKSNMVSASILKAPEERIKSLNRLSDFTPLDLDVVGSYAYIAAGSDGFRIVDLTAPEEMTVTGALNSPSCSAIKVRGDYAYLACKDRGLTIINIMDPVNPIVTGSRPTTDAVDVDLKENYVFISDGDSGIKVIDVSDTRLPTRKVSIEDSPSDCLFLDGDILLSGNSGGVVLYDISNPLEPQKISTIPAQGITDVAVSDNKALLLSKISGLIIYDISAPDTPRRLSNFPLGDPVALSVEGSYAYIADGRDGLNILNISNPAKPFIFDSFKTGKALAIDNFEEDVIVAEASGLSAFRTFLNGVSFITGFLNLGGSIHSISLLGNLAFLSAKSDGLRIIDISTPDAPVEKDIANRLPYSEFSVIQDSLLYTASGPDELSIYNIDDISSGELPEEPISSHQLNSDIRSIAVSDDGICSVVTEGGVRFYDNGSLTGSIEETNARYCKIKDRTAFISNYREGLEVWDISNTEGPGLYTRLAIDGADFITLDDSRLFVIGRDGVYIFDVSNGQRPVRLGYIKSYFAEKALARGDFLYIAEGYKGLSIYNINDPANPGLASVCDTVYAADLVVEDDYAFVTDGTGLNTVQIFIPDWVK